MALFEISDSEIQQLIDTNAAEERRLFNNMQMARSQIEAAIVVKGIRIGLGKWTLGV